MTYEELNERANQLARILREQGVKPDQIVGIMVERSLEMIIGIFGILKAGGAYLPILPDYPEERIDFLLKDSNTNILLTQSKLMTQAGKAFEGEILNLEDEGLYSGDGSNLEYLNTSDDLAYVIYTSGSTGKPKGVMIEHWTLMNRLNWMQKICPFAENDTILQKTPFTFDVSVQEMFFWVFRGSQVCFLTPGGEKEPEKIVETIEKYQITTLHFVPSMLSVFLDHLENGVDLQRLTSLKQVLASGEALQIQHVEKFNEYLYKPFGIKLHNLYGPTEATIDVTHFDCSISEGKANIPIGKPIDNIRIYIVDQSNRLQPLGVPGELCIAGDGLARGYLNRSDLTKEKFVSNPFESGERMYKTGDMVRWLSTGNIEFLGRMDHQVKIRGFRIEPGEIEARMLQHEEIKEVVIIPRDDEDGSKYLCAYLVSGKELTVSELREWIGIELPEYMIPSYFVRLEAMPLTSNGKLNRKALPEPDGTIQTGTEYVAPQNEIEEKLALIWEQILGVAKIGINDNFFDLGGHSLKATVLVSQIHKELNVEVPLSEFFKRPTIKQLAEYIEVSEENLFSAIQPVEEKEYYPASSAQKRLYIQCQFEGAGVSYNMPAAMVIEGRLNSEKVEQTFKKLVQRHETLRTSFHMLEGEVVQKVHSEVDFEMSCTPTGESERQMCEEFVRPFDLSNAPLLRIGLAKLAEDRHLMMFDMHHIISDAVSMEILVREFVALYQGRDLPELRVQYKDFSVWQNELFKTDLFESQKQYWLDTFAGQQDSEIPVLNMPTDYLRPSIQSFRGDRINFGIDDELTAQLKELATQSGSTMYMVLLSAYNVLLYKYTGQEDIVIGSPIAGRRHADLQNIIGMFVNMLALRNAPCSKKTFIDFLSEVRNNTLKAYDNQDYQFEELVEKLNLKRDLSRNTLFDVVFSLQNAQSGMGEMEGLRLIPSKLEYNISKVDLTLDCIEQNDGILFSFEYCIDLFTQKTIERLASHYVNILRQIAENSDVKLADINMLADAEREQILYDFNATEMEYAKDKTLHELFIEQVEKTPEKIALVFEDEKLTYGELNQKTNHLAQLLREYGVARDEIIGIMVERSIDMVIGILSVLKAGGAYMPIDPDYPVERIRYMLDDSNTKILLTNEDHIQKHFTDRIEYSGRVINLKDSNAYTGDGHNLENINSPEDLVYVMYTSGSTGKPKGVMIEHRGVVSLSKYYNEMFSLAEGRNIVHMSNVSFDTSVVEIFPPLIYGACIYVIRKELALDRSKFMQFVEENQIHIAQFVPMTLKEILAQSEKPESLNNIIVGGDQLEDTLKDEILSLGYQLTNHYGPTEGTVDAIVAKCEESKSTIGKPISNTKVFILDQDNNLSPVGVPGELCIAGVGLARGYLNRPELTVEKFVANPVVPEEKMYRTGDLACWQSDGNITFLGRIDNQVKIRGYRIELGEIESQLLKHENIEEVVVVDKVDSNGNKYLCAYIVAEDELTVSEMRDHLSKELPDYMIPGHFMQIDNLPLTHNGKVDRNALPEPDGSINTGVEYVAPTNEIEEKLVEIWQEVLGVEGIGITHNFFEVGGHSLKAMNLLSKIHQELNVEVPLSEVFKSPTIKELTQYIATSEENLYASIQSVEEHADYYPASSAQRRLYILCGFKGAGTSINYNMPAAMTIEGILDRDKFDDAFKQLIQRHETLRTSFTMVDGEIVQQIHQEVEFEVSYVEAREDKVSEKINGFVRPFDLSKAPLLRVGLVKLAEDQHILLFDMHHIISDGLSTDILVREFVTLYQGTKLPELRIQYKDFSVWQNELFKTGVIESQEKYWLDTFTASQDGKIPVLKMPTDYPRPAKQSFEGNNITFKLDEELTAKLNTLSKEVGATLYMTLLAVYNVLLSKYTGQEDIVVGSPIAGRPHPDLQGIIGIFVNTLAMRNYPVGNKTFKEFVVEVKENALKVYENQDYQFEQLVYKLDMPQDLSRNPLFDTMFILQNTDAGTELEIEGLKFGFYGFENTIAKFDMTLNAQEVEDRILFVLNYCTKLFKEETMERLGRHFIFILKQILDNPEIKLNEISLLSQEERDQLLDNLQQTMSLDDEEMSQEEDEQIEADFDF